MTMMRYGLLLLIVLIMTTICCTRRGLPARVLCCTGQGPQMNPVQAATIETIYDSIKDRTTVRLAPVQISGEKDKYLSLHMAPSFSFSGQEPQRPDIIDFELQTVVKARLLDTDLYVVFIVDGETIFLSSNRWGIPRPVHGRRWVGERLVFHMPYETFMEVTKAKKFELKFDGLKFEVGEPQMQSLRELASKMN